MASLGFAACKQELLSDRRTRQLLNYFRLRNLNKKTRMFPNQTEHPRFLLFSIREKIDLLF